jgi:hypothetical protein
MSAVDEKDREIWIGDSRMYLGDDNIIYETVIGEIGENEAMGCKEATYRFWSMVKGKTNFLIDLNRTKKTTTEARTIAQELFENERAGRVALFGVHPVARVVASFVIGAMKKKDMRFFNSRDEALSWLKE